MPNEVAMWSAITGPAAGAQDCYTTGLFDCVTLAILGDNAQGVTGYYFGHLTSHQYLKHEDRKGNAVATLVQFVAAYPLNLRIKTATNYQPMPDFSQSPDKMRPTSIEASVFALVRAKCGATFTADRMRVLDVPNGATATFKPTLGTLHNSDPLTAGQINDVGGCTVYDNWPLPAIVQEQQRRRAVQPRDPNPCNLL